MRRLLATLTAMLLCVLGLPATAGATDAAARPLGGGSVLVNPIGNDQCRASFAAVNGPTWYLVTGPGCADSPGAQLYSGASTLVGRVVHASPAYAVVHVTNTTDWYLVPWIGIGGERLVIGGAKETPVGGSVCLIDHALGYQCGTVLAKNETVWFAGGAITGLTRTNICASSRAVAYVTRDQAQGVPIGGSGVCTTSGTSWFTPIGPILARHQLTLLTG